MEIWKDIKGYEGLYQVSNLGRVKSLARKVIRAKNAEQTISERILKLTLDPDGYFNVGLHNNKRKTFKVHKLVAQTFLDNSNKLEVNHIDGNKKNNNISNLEYCTRGENIKHSYDLGLRIKKTGKDNHMSKIVLNTQNGVFYESISSAANTVGLSRKRLSAILNEGRINKTNFVLV